MHRLAPALPLLTLHFILTLFEAGCNINFLTKNRYQLPASPSFFDYFDLGAKLGFLQLKSAGFLGFPCIEPNVHHLIALFVLHQIDFLLGSSLLIFDYRWQYD